MFFFLSKIFWFLAQPLNLALILMAAGLLLLGFARRRLAFISVALAFLVLGTGGWTTVGALLLHPLEARFPRPIDAPAKVDGIIILGGGFEGGINLVRGGYELNASGDRFVEAAILAARYPSAKVVVTGGSGNLVLDGEADGDTAPRLLNALGVASDRLIMENKSRNTYENALFTKEMMAVKPGEVWLLVTSAFHMPRSMGLFRKAGFEVTAWPADYRTSGAETLGLAQDNVYDSLQNLTLAGREWAGLLAYRLTGRIDSILPSP
ncbi:YdcF family protein [Phyllobacterium sp. 21LDTY02-6]|uniref:YdcF family protein n=1 Tax=unclassified Phyllobacterium TaxID=2638441 RepID=UPI00202123B5|nr:MULTISPECIES: YdcF family protein [unclassified Phyllobacterium]MCO4316684.1 YdcF family protein [Phyllobacterium sp. 21LDTY02-6]MCX8281743.1 YdcF family protein [Phyllobacterium sp. 0TCS1.6C]MCX8294853.1 YdcF family protein [Phyllobacterium sp. 0TCS1.6A]